MLTHIKSDGKPTMVDVSEKKITRRMARAQAMIELPEAVLNLFDGKEIPSKKGPVISTAIVAGTMAAKKTGDLIPFCHSLGLDGCDVDIEFLPGRGLRVETSVRVEGKTGVEMEALVAASHAAMTVYDMCKAMSHEIRITNIELLEKRGGKSDYQKK